jgi:hypothetical protein
MRLLQIAFGRFPLPKKKIGAPQIIHPNGHLWMILTINVFPYGQRLLQQVFFSIQETKEFNPAFQLLDRGLPGIFHIRGGENGSGGVLRFNIRRGKVLPGEGVKFLWVGGFMFIFYGYFIHCRHASSPLKLLYNFQTQPKGDYIISSGKTKGYPQSIIPGDSTPFHVDTKLSHVDTKLSHVLSLSEYYLQIFLKD